MVNFGIDLNLFIKLRESPKTKLVIVLFKKLKRIILRYKEIIRTIKQEKNKNYKLKKRKNSTYLKEVDKIYLITENIKSKRLSRNLDYIKGDLFLILK